MWALEISHHGKWNAIHAFPIRRDAMAYAYAIAIEDAHWGWAETRVVWSDARPHGWAVYAPGPSSSAREGRRLLGVFIDEAEARRTAAHAPGRWIERQ